MRDTVKQSSTNSVFSNPLQRTSLFREQSLQFSVQMKHDCESVVRLVCRTFSALRRLPTGPNTGAGTCQRSARVHRRVHGHALLWQVPWARGVFMLLLLLLWLVRRRRKWMHRGSKQCMSVCVSRESWCFFFPLFKARYFHSSDSWLQLHSFFWIPSRDNKCLESEQTDLGPRCPL